MPGSPVFDPLGPPRIISFALSQQAGRGSSPVRLGLFCTTLLIRRPLHYSSQKLTVDGNESNVWEAGFFKRDGSDTNGRGDKPHHSTWVTATSLTRLQQWACRDYALRKGMDDWFFGASSTFGDIVERWRPPGLSGWGSWVIRSTLTTTYSLIPSHRWANAGTKLQETMEDWCFGKTVGSPDMHIMYTRVPYPRSRTIRVVIINGEIVIHISRSIFTFFVTSSSLVRAIRFANCNTDLSTITNNWLFGYVTTRGSSHYITYE